MYKKLHTGTSRYDDNILYTYYDKKINFTRIIMKDNLFYLWFYEDKFGIICNSLTDAINESIDKFNKKYGWENVLKSQSINNKFNK